VCDVPGDTEHLARRLRQVNAKLAFHAANAARVLLEERPLPWLPGNTRAGSKHKNAATVRREAALIERPSPQESQLQVNLLTALRHRLLLKLGLAGLRRAVAMRRTRLQLLLHGERLQRSHGQRLAFAAWKVETFPTAQQLEAAAAFSAARDKTALQQAFVGWRRHSAECTRLAKAEAQGQRALNARLLAAGLAHWRLWAAEAHLAALRSALLTGWLDGWRRRKVLSAWRKTASRTRAQRERLLSAAAGSIANPNMEVNLALRSPVPSVFEGLAATRASLAGLRACVAAHSAQVQEMHALLRWRSFPEGCEYTAAPSDVRRVQPYNPAAYASPQKSPRPTVADGAVEAAAAELFLCRTAAERARQRHNELEISRRELGDACDAALGRLEELKSSCCVALEAEEAACAAAIESQAALETAQKGVLEAQAECDAQEASLAACLDGAQALRAAADAARAALASAQQECASGEEALELWKSRVTAAAQELSRASAPTKPAATVKLVEARHRLEHEQHALEELRMELPTLIAAAESAAAAAEGADGELRAVREGAVAAAARCAELEHEMASASAQHASCLSEKEWAHAAVSTANAAVHDAETEAARLTEERSACQQQLLTCLREIELLEVRVAELEERHAAAVAEALEEAFPRWGEGQLLLELPPLEAPTPSHAVLKEDSVHQEEVVSPCSRAVSLDWTESNGDHEDDEPRTPRCAGESLSVDSTPSVSPSKLCVGVTPAAIHFSNAVAARRVLDALCQEAQLWRGLYTVAALGHRAAHLPNAFATWREVAACGVRADAEAARTLRLGAALRVWRAWAKRTAELKEREAALATELARWVGVFSASIQCICVNTSPMHASNIATCTVLIRFAAAALLCRRAARGCLAALRAHAAHQVWRRDALAHATRRRMGTMLQAWKAWAQTSRHRRRLLDAATASSERRLLANSLQHWRQAAAGRALLRRVLGTACALWQEQCGAAAYEAEFSLVQRCFAAWQLGMHAAHEERRERVMEAAAHRFRAQHLVTAGFSAFKAAVEGGIERQAAIPLMRAMLEMWRLAALGALGGGQGSLELRHRDKKLLSTAFLTWRSSTEESALR